MATHSNILALRISMDRGAWQAMVHRVTKSQTWLKRWTPSLVFQPFCRPKGLNEVWEVKIFRTSMPSQGSWFHFYFFQPESWSWCSRHALEGSGLFEAQLLFRPQFLCLFVAEDESLFDATKGALWLSSLAFKWSFIILSFLLYFSKASIKLSQATQFHPPHSYYVPLMSQTLHTSHQLVQSFLTVFIPVFQGKSLCNDTVTCQALSMPCLPPLMGSSLPTMELCESVPNPIPVWAPSCQLSLLELLDSETEVCIQEVH